MADNVTLPGTGAVVGSDEVTIGAVLQQVQRVKLVDGADGGTELIGGTAARGINVDPRLKVVRLQVTPTVSTTPAYTIGDNVGGLMTFANAVRASGGACRLDSIQVVDKASQVKDLDLVLFDRSIAAPTDNAAFDPTDTELGYVVGIIQIGGWSAFADNSVVDIAVGREIVLNGTDLFGVLVSRSNPTYVATTDLVVTVTVVQE